MPSLDRETTAINFAWLIRLRWGAAVGQLVLVLAAVRVLGIELPLGLVVGIIGVQAGTNLACGLWIARRRFPAEWMPGAIMMGDVLLLTALLYLTGGPFNPFSFLYLIYITLAAVVLRAGWTWALVATALGCYGYLFYDYVPLPLEHDGAHGHHMQSHLQGMWVAFGVTAAFIVYFTQRVRKALAARDADLAAARAQSDRQQRLASLATLAAGATHELATPLSTIALVAKELERHLLRHDGDGSAVSDARLIRQEVRRCREILEQLATDAGESPGEPFAVVGAVDVLNAAIAESGEPERVRVVAENQERATSVRVPPRALGRAVKALIKNALHASRAGEEVEVTISRAGPRVRFEVRDRGHGMPAEVLARAGEPFFTTKDGRGGVRGMGLGLFLTRAIVERVGGELKLDSTSGEGTAATLTLWAEPESSVRAPLSNGAVHVTEHREGLRDVEA